MRVGILGTGDVGRTLGKAFLTLGHEVMLGAREIANEKARNFAEAGGPRASAGTFADAARFSEIAVLSTKGTAIHNTLALAGSMHFEGKLVLDTTNPLDMEGGLPRLTIGHTDSAGELVQRLLPTASVVKVFNTVGHAHFFRPEFPGGPPDMFIAGNNENAKVRVVALLRDFGWNAVDLGGIEASRVLEPLCLAWVLHAIRSGTWNHAFKLLHK